MNRKVLEDLLTYAISTGADFAEIYIEKLAQTVYKVFDSKLDTISTSNSKGVGVRISKDDEIYYASTNDINKNKIKELINNIIGNIKGSSNRQVKLSRKKSVYPKIIQQHKEFSIEEKKAKLLEYDGIARKQSELITQVSTSFYEIDKNFTIANSNGKYVSSSEVLTRVIANIYAEKNNEKESQYTYYGAAKGYEILNDIDFTSYIIKAAKTAVEKLDAKDFKGGQLPVVINHGFGAVIFHEACGHGLEATSVATKSSVFSDDFGKKIASEKVTLIDDGTIEGSWGTNIFDDEGEKTKKNILIENGILKSYLVDSLNSNKMNHVSNGCSRRASYQYAPTSRMSNTYLSPGNDSIEDMIKSIKLGVYCEEMSGGVVQPTTGDFNFAVETAWLIENGKISHRIKGITLIGNSKEILKNVEMVSSDLKIESGFCGSKSGIIPVTIGQPTIKISSILVGGKE